MPPMKISGVDRCGCLIQSARLESSDLRRYNTTVSLPPPLMSTLSSLSTPLTTRFQPAITIGCDSELGRIQSVWAEYQFFICSWGSFLFFSFSFLRFSPLFSPLLSFYPFLTAFPPFFLIQFSRLLWLCSSRENLSRGKDSLSRDVVPRGVSTF